MPAADQAADNNWVNSGSLQSRLFCKKPLRLLIVPTGFLRCLCRRLRRFLLSS